MADPTPVDRAFVRYTRLSSILQEARTKAFAGSSTPPGAEEELSFLGEREDVVRQEFSELTRLIEHLAILDMCAAFEGGFADKLDGATSEAAKIVGEHYGLDYFIQLRGQLIRSPRDYRTLGRICELLKDCLAPSVLQELRALAEVRNGITHGKPLNDSLPVGIAQAQTLLNGVIREFWNPTE